MMKHTTMANLLRTVIVILVLCGLIMQVWWIPVGSGISLIISWEFIFLMNAALLPCYAVTVIGWLISNSIARECEFSRRNATLFRWIFGLALGDSLFFILGSVLLIVFSKVSLWCVLITLPLSVLGICVAICAAVMSHLIDKAANMQEDCDLTI